MADRKPPRHVNGAAPPRRGPTKEQLRAQAEAAFKTGAVTKVPEAPRPDTMASNQRAHERAQARVRGFRV